MLLDIDFRHYVILILTKMINSAMILRLCLQENYHLATTKVPVRANLTLEIMCHRNTYIIKVRDAC